VVGLLAFCFCCVSINAALTYTVQVGAQGTPNTKTTAPGPSVPGWYFNLFYPNNITISVGDTINFMWGTIMEHTVSIPYGMGSPIPFESPLGNPMNYTGGMLSSGIGVPQMFPFGYNVTFNMAGGYQAFCALHAPFQLLWINVVTGAEPLTPAQSLMTVNTLASQSTASQPTYDGLVASMNLETPMKVVINGKNYWQLMAGFDDPVNGVAGLRMFPYQLTITAGDAVSVFASHSEPHLFGFNGTQPVLVDFPAPIWYSPMDGMTALTPVSTPTGPQIAITYDGHPGHFIGSGFIWGVGNPGSSAVLGITMWNVTFTTPGVYNIVCALHDDFGMAGTITVNAAPTTAPTTAPTPPSSATLASPCNILFASLMLFASLILIK